MNSSYITVLALLLLQLIPVAHPQGSSCRLSAITERKGLILPGDIILGAMVPIHVDKIYQKVTFRERPPETTCTVLEFDHYQHFQAMSFAVEEINMNPAILPNVTLGFQAYDSCDVLRLDLAGSLQVLSGSDTAIPNYRCLPDVPLTAVIGAALSTNSILLAHILGLYRYPQISHLSTSRVLSDHNKFPSFFRTVLSDAFQSQGLAKLVLHFGWTWVGLLAMDDDYGQQGIQLVKQEIVKGGACVAFNENIALNQPDRNAPHIVKVIKESTAKAIVVFSLDIHLVPILDEMLKQNVTDRILVASEAWSVTNLDMSQFTNILSGTIGLALYSGIIPGFSKFIGKVHPFMELGGTWAKMFWEKTFSCTFSNEGNLTKFSVNPLKSCTGQEDLQSIHNSFTDVSNLRTTYNIYMAVHVVAKALADLSNCLVGEGSLSSSPCVDIHHFKPWQLLHYMKKVRVKMNGGREIYFNENGDPPAAYDIVNWQWSPEGAIKQVKIGSYDTSASPGGVFTINSSILRWDNDNSECSSRASGAIYLNENGDPPAVYDIVNWQRSPEGAIDQVRIGSYDTSASPGGVFTINSSILRWDNDNSECSSRASGAIYFNKNGDPPAAYDIVNWQRSPEGAIDQVKIGSYDTSASPGGVFTINSSILLWDNDNIEVPLSVCSQNCPPGFWKAAKAGKPSCCFECIPCSLGEISNDTGSFNCFKCPWDQWPDSQKSQCLPKDLEYLSYNDPLGCTLAVISLVSSLTPDVILRLFVVHKSTPVVKANNYSLSCLLLVSLSLCFLCSLAFIGYPQAENCLLRQALFGMVFGLCISCVLAKTIIVMIAFMATKPSSNLRKWTKPWVSYMIVICGFMVQFILCIIWLSLTPPFPQYNAETKPGFIIVECNEGSSTAFWTMLGYLFLLATISFVVAFLARKLPDSFNEAQFITFSMLAFLSVWISYIPASLSAQGKYTVAMEIFAILASSWALVICMFFPKCFIIVVRPNLNTKENIMRKDRG